MRKHTATVSKLAAACLALLALLALPASTFAAEAAATRTREVTEAQINASYWVTHPANRNVTGRSVDLQPGVVVVSETWTRRGGQPKQVVATLTATVSNGRVYWKVESATVDGADAGADLLAQVNTRISSAWRTYARQRAGAGRVSAVEITDDAIVFTLVTR